MVASVDVKGTLDGQLRQLHLPTFRESFEPLARRAEQETLSYEQYLLELTNRECDERRTRRIQRLLKDSRLPLEKDLASFDLKRMPGKVLAKTWCCWMAAFARSVARPNVPKASDAAALTLLAWQQWLAIRNHTSTPTKLIHAKGIVMFCLLRCCAVLALLLTTVGGIAFAEPMEQPQEVVVYVAGQEGYAAFRIPAIISTTKGILLAFAEGRKDGRGDNGNIDTVLKRSTDGGRTWSKLSVVVNMGADAICNPCPVVDCSNGRICLPLIWKAGENSNVQNKRGTGRGTMEVFLLFSDDEGLTWSKPENITRQVKRADWTWYVVGPGNGIQLASGRLLIPCDHRKKQERSDKASYSHIIYSDDHGKTWRIGGECEHNTNECQVAQLANGDLLMSIRSHHSPDKVRAFSVSSDQGLTWSPVRFHRELPDPTCQGSLIHLPNGEGENELLFSNPASSKRERMTVRLSEDGGQTWAHSRVLHAGPAGYSSLVSLPNGRAGCLYEQGAGRGKEMQNLVFATFDLAWLQASTTP